MSSIDVGEWADAYIEAQLDPDLLKGDGDHPLWWAVERSMFCAREAHGEELWLFVLAVTSKAPCDKVLGVLAAGPLEELIAYAGNDFIDRIETEARRSPAFRHVLGGVWQNSTPDDIWRRVEAVRIVSW